MRGCCTGNRQTVVPRPVQWKDAGMPSDRTAVTELGTALGMLGHADVDEALEARSPVMHSLSPEIWARLGDLRRGGAFDPEFHAAFENGRSFLHAADGLRGRLPRVIEWKGTGRAPGDEVTPADLRVDHVYLVSCKYLSDILFNVSPTHVFDDLLLGGRSSRSAQEKRLAGDWYAELAPDEYQELYGHVRSCIREWARMPPSQLAALTGADAKTAVPVGRSSSADRTVHAALPGLGDDDTPGAGPAPRRSRAWSPPPTALAGLPASADALTTEQRDVLATWLRPGWPGAGKTLYARLSRQVSVRSVQRWHQAMDQRGGNGEAVLWRLLRMGSAPYFVLGSSANRTLRLRIATPWDWRQQFQLLVLEMEAQAAGQPRVGWHAVIRDRVGTQVQQIEGHIEVRWSHGRFGGPPEAKGYLDTPHHLVPGYFALQ
jgi:hypothetical protein